MTDIGKRWFPRLHDQLPPRDPAAARETTSRRRVTLRSVLARKPKERR